MTSFSPARRVNVRETSLSFWTSDWKDLPLDLDLFLQGLPLDLDRLDVRRRDGQGHLPGDEIVPPEAGGDVDDVAAPAQLLHVLFQDDLHVNPRRRGEGP